MADKQDSQLIRVEGSLKEQRVATFGLEEENSLLQTENRCFLMEITSKETRIEELQSEVDVLMSQIEEHE